MKNIQKSLAILAKELITVYCLIGKPYEFFHSNGSQQWFTQRNKACVCETRMPPGGMFLVLTPFSIKQVNDKFTGSNILVSMERSCHKDYTNELELSQWTNLYPRSNQSMPQTCLNESLLPLCPYDLVYIRDTINYTFC